MNRYEITTRQRIAHHGGERIVSRAVVQCDDDDARKAAAEFFDVQCAAALPGDRVRLETTR